MNKSVNNIELKNSPLYKFVTSYRNIYRAIYALDSYIDELYLLDKNEEGKSDLELYYKLHDKYNWDLINSVIEQCIGRISDILLNPNEYFETSVYFSLKKYDDKKHKVKFRPLHTAPLIDQICMVAMLQVLMFEDSDEENENGKPGRSRSDLLKSIPDNFYGNRGSLKLERIYERWMPNYQAYNRKIVESCDKYSKSHKYEYEVSLDIREFFPSISPFYLFVKICDVLKERYRKKVNNQDKSHQVKEQRNYELNLEILKRITSKLLFLKIKNGNQILDSALVYYGDKSDKCDLFDSKYKGDFFTKGVAQGLPQSYFFGNLCMTDVRRIIMEDDMFKGKDYFYVDDSVIYVRGSGDYLKRRFKEKIEKLNKELEGLTSFKKLEEQWETAIKDSEHTLSLLGDIEKYCGKAVEFHKRLENNYKIQFHSDNKSSIQTIDAADQSIKSMGGLGRNASGADSFFMEGDDRRISREKMNALNDYAWNIINQLEEKQNKEEADENKDSSENAADSVNKQNAENNDFALQLKLFKRFRKIFLSRNMWLDTMESGKVDNNLKVWFLDLLSPETLTLRKEKPSPADMPDALHKGVSKEFNDEQKQLWFDLTDKESFRAEAVQLLKCSSLKDAKDLKDKVTEFEKSFSGVMEESYPYLYFQKYLDGVIAERNLNGHRYESLRKSFRSNFPAAANVDAAKAIELLREFIHQEFHFVFSSHKESDKESEKNNMNESDLTSPLQKAKEGMFFMKYLSDEFKRRMLNAYFSVLVDVNPSEEVPFVKMKGGNINYAVFRILVWLRNPNFDFKDFWHFLSKIEPHALPERMIVDNGLPEVVKIFIRKVANPEKVDHLVITHRIVKGLWQNGSKFLNSYTLHNEEHAVKLIMLSMDIIRRIDYFQLKQLDYYILFLSCYLHDISMVIHPDLHKFCHAEEDNMVKMERYFTEMKKKVKEWEGKFERYKDPVWLVNFWKSFGGKMTAIFNEVYDFFESDIRSKHPQESAQFIKTKRHDLFRYLEETIVEAVANAGEDHGKDSHNVYDMRSFAKNDVISTKYISIILRLADLMDVSNDRINYHLLNENVIHLSAKSKFHWISHLITDEIALIPNYNIEYEFIKQANGKKIKKYYIRETLRLYLLLNMKSFEPMEREDNNDCRYWCKAVYNQDVAPERYKDFEGITLRFEDKPCKETACQMVCRWMNSKHYWLFPELARLQKYLNTVNFEPFRTEIEVNILFKDFADINIKPSLFDDVRRYLKNEHNE